MNDEFITLMDRYKNPQEDLEGFFIYDKPDFNSQQVQQLTQGLLGKSADIAGNMVGLGQQQAQEAIAGSNAVRGQQEAVAAQAQQQAAQAMADEQRKQQQQGGGLLGRLLTSYITGGLNSALGGVLNGAGAAGDVYKGGWLV